MRWPVALALLLLAGCEKSFDERYAATEKKIREQAGSIDQELAKRERERREAEAAAGLGQSQAAEPTGDSTAIPSAVASPAR